MGYGEKFQCIRHLRHHGPDWLAELQLPDDLPYESQRNAVHPALLVACLHVVFADVHRHGYFDRIYLALRLSADGTQTLTVPPDDLREIDEILADVILDRRTLIVFARG